MVPNEGPGLQDGSDHFLQLRHGPVSSERQAVQAAALIVYLGTWLGGIAWAIRRARCIRRGLC